MVSLLDDVLLVGRGQAGRSHVEAEVTDLTALCEQLIREGRIAVENPPEVDFGIEGHAGSFETDPRVFRRILGNLLGNALKYTPADGRVAVELQCTDADLKLTVRDEGIGLDPSELDQLFEPFHRGGNVGDIAGSGLGLTIVRAAVVAHGGELDANGSLGEGCTFTVRLPRLVVSPETAAQLR